MAPWTLLTTGGVVLSAASCVVPARFWLTCACCASDARNSGSSWSSGGDDDGNEGCCCGDVSGDGSRPVLTNTHVGSVQPKIIEGNAGGLAAVVGFTSAMNGSTVLPAPPLAVPVANELVMVPSGKLEFGIAPTEKLTKVAFSPAKAPTALSVVPVALPAAEEASMLPKLAPTKPPMTSRLPMPVTDAVGAVKDCSIEPRFTPTNPPR